MTNGGKNTDLENPGKTKPIVQEKEITGHSTPVMLKKYIKADELEVVDKITDK